MTAPHRPTRPKAFDLCPRTRSNDPVTVAVEFTYSSACELLQFFGYTEAAFTLARHAAESGHVNGIAAETRHWARLGGSAAAEEHKQRILRALDKPPEGTT